MITFSNIVSLLIAASEGKVLQVNTTTELGTGIRFEPAKDRFFDGDVIADTKVFGLVKSTKAVVAKAVYVKSVKMLMEIALNVTPVIRAGQTLAWDLDNTEGKLYICPVKAKATLASMKVNMGLLNT